MSADLYDAPSQPQPIDSAAGKIYDNTTQSSAATFARELVDSGAAAPADEKTIGREISRELARIGMSGADSAGLLRDLRVPAPTDREAGEAVGRGRRALFEKYGERGEALLVEANSWLKGRAPGIYAALSGSRAGRSAEHALGIVQAYLRAGRR